VLLNRTRLTEAGRPSWLQIHDFRWIVLGPPQPDWWPTPLAGADEDETPPDEITYWGEWPYHESELTIAKTYPRERIVVAAGSARLIADGEERVLNPRDFVDVPDEGVTLGATEDAAELLWVAGDWQDILRCGPFQFVPGGGCEVHYHDGDEYWFINRGHVTLYDDGQTVALRPGQMFAARRGVEHGVPQPEEIFEGVGIAMGLDAPHRDGHLVRSLHGPPAAISVHEGSQATGAAVDGGAADMPMVTLGKTGIVTSALGIGTWGYGPISAPSAQVGSDEEIVAILKKAFVAGMRLIDSAASYDNEERIGRLIADADPPDDLVFSTKSGRSWPVEEGYTADHMRRSAEKSLSDLGVSHLSLMLIHDPRNAEDMAEIFGKGGALEGLRALQDEGLVGSIGVATGTLPPLWAAVRSGEFDVIQFPRLYTLLNTVSKDVGLLAAAKQRGMATILPAPFAGGLLATGAVPGAQFMMGPAPDEVLDAVRGMERRCAELGLSLPTAALAFVLVEQLVDVAVVGFAKSAEVTLNLGALTAGVSDAELQSIREAGRIDPNIIGGPDF
jgi:D-threo-aldose 1-dehydrogenase